MPCSASPAHLPVAINLPQDGCKYPGGGTVFRRPGDFLASHSDTLPKGESVSGLGKGTAITVEGSPADYPPVLCAGARP
jgi:hypothetical protein